MALSSAFGLLANISSPFFYSINTTGSIILPNNSSIIAQVHMSASPSTNRRMPYPGQSFRWSNTSSWDSTPAGPVSVWTENDSTPILFYPASMTSASSEDFPAWTLSTTLSTMTTLAAKKSTLETLISRNESILPSGNATATGTIPTSTFAAAATWGSSVPKRRTEDAPTLASSVTTKSRTVPSAPTSRAAVKSEQSVAALVPFSKDAFQAVEHVSGASWFALYQSLASAPLATGPVADLVWPIEGSLLTGNLAKTVPHVDGAAKDAVRLLTQSIEELGQSLAGSAAESIDTIMHRIADVPSEETMWMTALHGLGLTPPASIWEYRLRSSSSEGKYSSTPEQLAKFMQGLEKRYKKQLDPQWGTRVMSCMEAWYDHALQTLKLRLPPRTPEMPAVAGPSDLLRSLNIADDTVVEDLENLVKKVHPRSLNSKDVGLGLTKIINGLLSSLKDVQRRLALGGIPTAAIIDAQGLIGELAQSIDAAMGMTTIPRTLLAIPGKVSTITRATLPELESATSSESQLATMSSSEWLTTELGIWRRALNSWYEHLRVLEIPRFESEYKPQNYKRWRDPLAQVWPHKKPAPSPKNTSIGSRTESTPDHHRRDTRPEMPTDIQDGPHIDLDIAMVNVLQTVSWIDDVIAQLAPQVTFARASAVQLRDKLRADTKRLDEKAYDMSIGKWNRLNIRRYSAATCNDCNASHAETYIHQSTSAEPYAVCPADSHLIHHSSANLTRGVLPGPTGPFSLKANPANGNPPMRDCWLIDRSALPGSPKLTLWCRPESNWFWKFQVECQTTGWMLADGSREEDRCKYESLNDPKGVFAKGGYRVADVGCLWKSHKGDDWQFVDGAWVSL